MNDETFSLSDEIRAAKEEQLRRLKSQLFDQKTKSFDDNHNFTMSHFLVRPGGTIAVMGAGDGTACAEYARMKPHLQIIGLESNPQNVTNAQKKYRMPNLSVIQGDMEFIPFAENSLHGILHAGTLHRLYSRTGYNISSVMDALRSQIKTLRTGGLLVIRDYIMPQGNRFVLIELPDERSYGKTVPDMSDADLLLHFSQTARPLDTNGCEGFFIEEIEAKVPGTRLFRLPHKWAVEFVYRLDKRDRWEQELLQEYTFLTPEELSKQLDILGVRTIYTGPHWDEDITKQMYSDRFRLYSEDGKLMEYPPTTFITVAQKIDFNEPVLIQERRTLSDNDKPIHKLPIKTVRDEAGLLYDYAEMTVHTDDLLPFRIGDDGRLNILIRSGVPRPAVGAAPRGTPNIDGKVWSGFMFEPLVIPGNLGDKRDDIIREALYDLIELPFQNVKQSFPVVRYYPDPEKIAARTEAFAIEIDLPREPIRRHPANEVAENPLNPGFVREFDAADILKAVHVGLIPDTRLEIAVRTLMEMLGFSTDSFNEITLKATKSTPDNILTPEEIEAFSKQSVTYSVSDERAGTIKHVSSVFVEESRIDGLATGVSSRTAEMIIPAKTGTNTVVILPLTVDSSSGELMVGLEQRKLPAAHRAGGSDTQLQLPAFRLPENITTITEAKKFVAAKIHCNPEDIRQMGSSYFIHCETGPERIFPMSVYNPGKWTGQKMAFIHYRFVNYLLMPFADGPLRNKSTMGLMLRGKKNLQELCGYGFDSGSQLNNLQNTIRKDASQFTPPSMKID